MVDIFDEVNDDLRAERAQALLKRYGVLLVALVVLLVVGVAGWQAWRWKTTQQDNKVAVQFIDAMRKSAGPPAATGATPSRDEAATEFGDVAATAPEGYRTLARLREAALRASGGELPAALVLWDKVSADTQADPLLRGLADLLWVQHQVDGGEPPAVEGRIAPLVAPGNPWRALALESQAWLALRTGDKGKARGILTGLKADTGAPDGVRARAGALLSQVDETSPVPQGAGG